MFFLGGLSLAQVAHAQTQYTHDFSTPAALSGKTQDWPWNITATISIGGVDYELSQGGNSSWENRGSGGANGSASLYYNTAADSYVTIERKDNQNFKFYGLWLSYDCFSDGVSYKPPHLTVTYSGSNLPQEIFNDRNRQGLVLSKDVEVSSVTFYFSGLHTLNLDNLVVGPVGTALSSNANLSNLTLSGTTLSPAFNANTLSYTASVANAVTSVTVTPTKSDANATVSVNGAVLNGGATSRTINLNVGANTITTVVTAQNGSTKTYTVAITRAAAPSAPPVAGYVNALQFDGVNDYVEIPSQPSNQFSSETEFTVSLWFKANSMNRAGLFNRPSGGGDMQFWLTAENGIFIYGIDKHGTGWTWLGTGTAYKLGEWVQVTTVRRNVNGERRMEIYANGVLVGSDRVNFTSSASSAPIRIGTVINADGGFANGQIDNVSFWQKALTAQEIKTLGATTLNGNEAGLAGYWRFDETSGTIAYDATANANHGTLKNMDLATARVASTAGDFITKKNVAYAGKLTGSDPEGKPLSYSLVTGPSKGTLVLNANGTFTYTPNTNAVGADNFSYRVSNGTTVSNTAIVNVTIVELAAPSVPDLLSSSDTGISNNDNITSDNTPTFSGTATAGYTVTLYSGGSVVGTTTADGAGNWSITTTTLADGAHIMTAKAVDGTGSQSPASAALTVTIDTTAPNTTITGSPAAVTNATSATFTFTSNETSITFQASVNGSSFITASASLTLTGLSGGTHNVLIRAMDAAGNVDPTPASYTWTVDATAPAVTGITRHNPTTETTSANTVTFLVSFSESVTGLGAGDFTLTGTGTATGILTSVSGSGERYQVTVSDISGSGTLRLDMNASGTGITDMVGNGLSGGYTAGQTYTIDTTSPVITSVSVPANATYSAGQHLDFTINFSEAVVVNTQNGTPALGLTVGATSRQAVYVSGSGSTALSFRYTVQPGEQDTDGITLSAAIALNSGTITDALGNAAVLSLNGVASTAGVLVDAVAPTITSITLPNDGVYNLERERYLLFSVAFSENMQRTQGSYLELRVGTQIRKATLDWAYENAAYYAYAVQEGEQGTGLEVLALKSDISTPTDVQGNALSTGSTFPISRSNVRVDGIRPLITGLTVPANKIYKQGEHLDFTVRFSEKVELREAGPIFGPLSARATSEPELELPEPPADGNPFIPLKIGEKIVLALYNQGSGTEQISFRYTVQEGELDMDGIEVAPLIMTAENLIPGPRPMAGSTPPAGNFTITDLAGNYADDLMFDEMPATTGVLVDAVVPTLQSVSIASNNSNPAVAKVGGVITLQFVASEAIQPTVLIAGNAATVVNVSGLEYRATYTLTAANSEGVVPFIINYRDLAGNAGTAVSATTNSSSVTFDKTAPTGTLAINGGATHTASPEVTLSISATDVLTGVASMRFSNDNTTWSAWQSFAASQSWTLPAGNGNRQVYAQLRDGAGNIGTVEAQIILDNVPLTLTLSSDVQAATNKSFEVTFTFSKAATGFTIADLTVVNGTASNLVTADNKVYKATITPALEGEVRISVAAGVAVDVAGNLNAASNTITTLYDHTRPALTLATTAANPTNAPFDVTFTFSEEVSGFDLTDITVTNGTASNLVATDGLRYSARITPAANGEVTVSVATDKAQDAAGNQNLASNVLRITFDTDKPTLLLTSTAPAAVNAPFSMRFAFSKDVTGFAIGDIALANGAAADFVVVDARTYTVRVIPAAEGEVRVAVAADAAQDGAGNGSTASNILTRQYDITRPAVVVSTSASDPVNSAFSVTFEFSEEVSGFAARGIAVTNGTLSQFSQVDGRRYSALVTPVAAGEVTVQVPANAAADAASNGTLASNTLTRVYDADRPAVVLASTAPNPINRAFQVSVTFTEPVTGLTVQDLTVANATLSGLTTTDNMQYTVEVSPLADGLVTVSVPANVAQDAAGNGNTASAALTRTFNATRPTLALSTKATSPTNAAFEVTFTFSKEVSGFEVADIAVSNGAAAAFTQVSAQVYTARITPTAEGEVIVSVMENVARDAAGNGNTAATALKLNIDKTQPTVVLASSAPEKLNTAFEVTVTFSETVIGFTAADVTVVNGTVTNFEVKGDKEYALQITPQANGEVRVSIAAGVAQDAAGNLNLASEQITRLYDTTRPAVTVATAVTSPVNTAFTVRFTFSESVESFELNNITVANGSVSNLIKESATVYTALVTPGANGVVTVSVAENVTQDAFGNGNLASNQLQIGYDVSQPVLVLSTTAAEVVKAPFVMTFTFSKAVTGFELQDIAVTNGAASAFTQVSAQVYTALVTPQADGEVGIAVAADVARDAAGNGNLKADALTRIYDATKPTLVLSTEANSPINAAFEVVFTFSETVSGFALADIAVAGGTVSNLTATAAGKVYTATITPSAEGEVTISVAADVAEDNAGNGNTASNTLRLQYDKTRPAVTLATTAPALTNAAIPVTITFSEPVTGFALADFTITNGTAADLTKVSETKYSVLVTPTLDGEVSIAIAENKVADAATNGNTASNVLSLTYDGTAPAGYAVAWSAARVDVSNLEAITLLLTGAEPGTAYTYRITSGEESTEVTGTGEVTGERVSIANLDLEKLKDGTLTVQLYLTDKAGNKGAEVTAQVVKITRNIASVTEPAMIQVPIRTKFEQIQLPATVAVTYSTGETAQVKVRWEAGNYDGTKAGPYVLTGILELAEMTTNLDNLTAKVTVEVQPNKVPTALAFSATTFKPDATAAEVIGTLTTTDPDDTEFVYTLVSGEGDAHNALFEIRDDQVYLKSNNGLSGMTSFTIRVRSTDPYLNTIERAFTLTKQAYDRTVDQLKIVNAFSPNGDGINDNWTIPELRFYNEVYIQVFDRSGVRVFETNDPEKGWDGRGPNGQILKGAFLFTVEVKDINWVKRGVVTILSK
ncbi:gliding motility-associated C-terminal domain-containing protein [Pontibacter indicus]|uniref:Gliding motility-associated C-terminal domain-containing protein n=1 Tax=Pontibacter indicus TaxID=1317125 RepID=A0A1R3XNP7_9BACT|nr:gliding motility-associated C-terminal domain-containing protein [Pontibacter indicus]